MILGFTKHVWGQTQLVQFSCGYGEVGRGDFLFFKLCLVWRVECSLSTWTFDFPSKFFFSLLLLGWGFKAKSSQVSDMFLKEFPIASHFYPISFGKCCPPFTKIFCKAPDENYDEPKTYGYHEMYEGYGPYAYLWCKVPLKDLLQA